MFSLFQTTLTRNPRMFFLGIHQKKGDKIESNVKLLLHSESEAKNQTQRLDVVPSELSYTDCQTIQ